MSEQLLHDDAGFTEQQSPAAGTDPFLFFFSSPVRSYQDGIWETLDKIDAGLVKY